MTDLYEILYADTGGPCPCASDLWYLNFEISRKLCHFFVKIWAFWTLIVPKLLCILYNQFWLVWCLLILLYYLVQTTHFKARINYQFLCNFDSFIGIINLETVQPICMNLDCRYKWNISWWLTLTFYWTKPVGNIVPDKVLVLVKIVVWQNVDAPF